MTISESCLSWIENSLKKDDGDSISVVKMIMMSVPLCRIQMNEIGDKYDQGCRAIEQFVRCAKIAKSVELQNTQVLIC